MKWLACASAIGLFVFGAAFQDSLPALLQQHLKTLREAQSLTATITVTPIGDAAVEYKLSYSKPNFLKVSGPDGFTLADGKNIYRYSAADKSYSEVPLTEESFNKAFRKELWAWSPFFAKADKDFAKAGKAGATRNMKGNVVTEVSVTSTQENLGQATIYMDQKLGLARGFNLKTPDKEYLAIASEIKVSNEALPETEFAFAAPAGATKVDPAAAPKVAYAQVQDIMNKTCMPCHSAGQRAGNIALTNHQGVMATVTPGDAAASRLVKSLYGKGAAKMPKNRPSLPDAQIKLIEAWINDGAKQ